MKLTLLVFTVFLFAYGSHAKACNGKVLTVSFLSGIRYLDGYGDLALNRSVIENEYKSIVKRYGDCVKINVVYIPEVENPVYKNSLVKNKYEVVRKMFDGDVFNEAIKSMFEANGNVKQPHFLDAKTGISHYTVEEYTKAYGNKGVDVQLMVSDMANTLSNPATRAMYDIPEKVLSTGHTVSFLENNGKQNPRDVVELAENEVSRRSTSKKLNVKVNTGVGASGLYLDDGRDIYPKDEVLKFIEEGIPDDKFFTLKGGENHLRRILKSDPVIVPAYLNSPRASLLSSVSPYSIFMSFSHSLEHPEKDYIILSNQFADMKREKVLSLFETHYLSDIRNPLDEELMRTKFKYFLDAKSVILNSGKEWIPPKMYKSFFSPKNGAKFQIASGATSYLDIMSTGGYPLYLPRTHFTKEVQSMRELIAKSSKDLQLAMDKDFIKISQNLEIANLKGSAQFQKFTKQYTDYEPSFGKLTDAWKKEANAYDMIDDVIDAFYQAKQTSTSGNIGSDVLEKSIFEAYETKNKFISHLGQFTESYNPQPPAVTPGMARTLKPDYYNFCINRNIKTLLDPE